MSLMDAWAAARKTAIRTALASGNREYAQSLAEGASADSWGASNWITEWDNEQAAAAADYNRRVQEQQAAIQANRQREQAAAAAAQAARVEAERVAKEIAARKLFQSNMQTLGVNNPEGENAPRIVGGAAANASAAVAEGANVGRPRRQKAALSSQLGLNL